MRERTILVWKSRHTIWQVVVDSIIFGRQFIEKQFRKIGYPRVLILKTLGHLSQLVLHLDHSVQDKVRQHHQGVLLHDQVLIRQALVQLIAVFINDTAERNRNISEGDDGVTSDTGISGCLEDLEE